MNSTIKQKATTFGSSPTLPNQPWVTREEYYKISVMWTMIALGFVIVTGVGAWLGTCLMKRYKAKRREAPTVSIELRLGAYSITGDAKAVERYLASDGHASIREEWMRTEASMGIPAVPPCHADHHRRDTADGSRSPTPTSIGP